MNPHLSEVLPCNRRVDMGNTFLLERETWQLQVSALQSVREAEGELLRSQRQMDSEIRCYYNWIAI